MNTKQNREVKRYPGGKRCWHCERCGELMRGWKWSENRSLENIMLTRSAVVNVSASKFCYAFAVILREHKESSDVSELIENCVEFLGFLKKVLDISETRVMIFSGRKSYLSGRKEHQHAWIVMDSQEDMCKYNTFLMSVMFNLNMPIADFMYDGYLPAQSQKEMDGRMRVETEPYKDDTIRVIDEMTMWKSGEFEKEFGATDYYMFLKYKDATFISGIVSHV